MAGLEDPMTTFDEREKEFEKRFALDEEQKFKAVARRNKLFGLWVAEKLGKSDDDAGAYAKDVVAAEFDGGDAAVLKKVMGDLAVTGTAVSDDALRAKLDQLAAIAAAQVKAGT
jgi:hypothetical protein